MSVEGLGEAGWVMEAGWVWGAGPIESGWWGQGAAPTRNLASSPGRTDVSSLSTSRYNDFLHDPLSLCKACKPQANGENAISARSDLNPSNGSYPFQALQQRSHGGIDVKVPGLGPWVGSKLGALQGLPGQDNFMTCLSSCPLPHPR